MVKTILLGRTKLDLEDTQWNRSLKMLRYWILNILLLSPELGAKAKGAYKVKYVNVTYIQNSAQEKNSWPKQD